MDDINWRKLLSFLAENRLPVSHPHCRVLGQQPLLAESSSLGRRLRVPPTSSSPNSPSTPPLRVTHGSSLLPEWRVTAQGT